MKIRADSITGLFYYHEINEFVSKLATVEHPDVDANDVIKQTCDSLVVVT
jgi:hypothetical protein